MMRVGQLSVSLDIVDSSHRNEIPLYPSADDHVVVGPIHGMALIRILAA